MYHITRIASCICERVLCGFQRSHHIARRRSQMATCISSFHLDSRCKLTLTACSNREHNLTFSEAHTHTHAYIHLPHDHQRMIGEPSTRREHVASPTPGQSREEDASMRGAMHLEPSDRLTARDSLDFNRGTNRQCFDSVACTRW